MTALKRQIEILDATLTDLATGENQQRFTLVTQRRDQLNERLTTLKRINDPSSAGSTTNASTNNQNALVPRQLPAFQFYGSPRHAKNKARFDSAQSFLEEFRTVLDGHSLDIEQHWRRLMPLTVNSNSRAWLRELMGKDSVNSWDSFCSEIIKQYSPPYTMFYRRYHLRTMRQKAGESLRQYSTKFQEYAVKTGIANNQELVFNYLCSLHRRYRKRSWSIVHNRYGEDIPDELEPIVQLVMTLASGERAPEEEDFYLSDSDDSDSSGDTTDDSENARHKRRRSNKKGKRTAKVAKTKGNCPIHKGSGHDEDNCNVIKKLVNSAVQARQPSSQASSSRSVSFNPRFYQPTPRMQPPRANNLCWHCQKVPFTPGHTCPEMQQARARRAPRFNNNNNIRSRMAHVNNNDSNYMQVDDDQLDRQTQGKPSSNAPSNLQSHSILVPLTIQNKQVKALLDTGADHSLIDIEFAKQNKWPISKHIHSGSVIM